MSPASRLGDAFHHASAKTGRVVAVWRRADHQEENLRAARPIRALPPLFASVLHERDLRSFQRAASMNLFVACALTVPVLPRPKVFRPPKMIHCRLFGSLLTTSPKKRCSPLTITTGPVAVGFHPKFPVSCGGGVRSVSVPVRRLLLTRRAISFGASHLSWSPVLAGKTAGFRRRLEVRINIHFNVILRSH